MLLEQLTSLEQWVAERLPEELHRPPLQDHVATLHQIIEQDLEPDPDDPGGAPSRIRQGVAEDRRVSIEDKEMRHGRKTKSKRFNGYKRHLAIDLDTVLVLAVAVLPANRPERDAAPSLVEDIAAQGRTIDALYIDRGYINAPIVDEIRARRGLVVCRPWIARNGDHFSKTAFTINMRDRTITCPAGEQQRFELGSAVEFPRRPATLAHCARNAPMPVLGGVARSRSRPTSRSSTSSASGQPPQRVGNNFASEFPSNTAKHTPAAARVVARATAVPARISLIFGAPVPSPTSRSSLAGSTLKPPQCRFAKPRNHGGFKPVAALALPSHYQG